MKSNMLILIILSVFIIQVVAHKTNKNETNTEYKTFLVKTQLTKEQLQALLQEGEKQQVNLKKKKVNNEEAIVPTTTVEETNNTSKDDDEILEKQIEEEIQEDALHPLEEFHVKEIKTSEVKTLVAQPQPKTKFVDFLYEKRFSKIYGYLSLLLFIFVLYYNKDSLLNQKRINNKASYRSLFDYDSTKEYMLVKTQ